MATCSDTPSHLARSQGRLNAFPSSHRLLRSAEFKRVAQVGRKVNSKHFLIFVVPTQAPPRIGITITKKIDSRAARRNRLRRRVREIFRKLQRSFIQGVDLVVIARSGSAALDLNTISNELIATLERAGILPKKA